MSKELRFNQNQYVSLEAHEGTAQITTIVGRQSAELNLTPEELDELILELMDVRRKLKYGPKFYSGMLA